VLPERLAPSIPVEEAMIFLKSRIGRLDGVVISGGEPTVNEDLPVLCRMIKGLGFDVKLDTNGTHPDMVRGMIEEGTIDFIAMDVKGPLEKYVEIAARPIDLEAIKNNVRLMTGRLANALVGLKNKAKTNNPEKKQIMQSIKKIDQ